MRKRFVPVALGVAFAALAAGATLATGAGRGLIRDDGHTAVPGSLDDGRALLPNARISAAEAVSVARRAAPGGLGQVDLQRDTGRLVFSVDIGNREVHVDATSGKVAAIVPQS